MKIILTKTPKQIFIATAILFCLSAHVIAQAVTQTVRGVVVDKVSQSPVAGAVVVVLNTTPARGTSTDMNGRFTIDKVTLGRHHIRVSYMGYKEQILSNITVNAGKETVLTIQLEEQIVEANEVVIHSRVEKNKPLNQMSTVSTRTFSVEETQKFAAAVNDPARMATSFAGVVSGNDGSNTISIRGNAPNALLWRMEGVDIPNPNHFSNVGTSGGGISILSAQLLNNSDFMTGAFAAEYGNALGGVFDLKLRKGNSQKREHTFQLGVLGIDIASEGPFKKGYDGSYLFNYRYSTLSILDKMGVKVAGDGVTTFQDLSFNISLPAGKAGNFSLFGFGGLSSQERQGKKDSLLWNKESDTRYPSRFDANTGAAGISHTKNISHHSYLKSSVTFSGTDNSFSEQKLNSDYAAIKNYEQSFVQSRLAFSTTLTNKLDSRNSIRTGFIVSHLSYDLEKSVMNDSLQVMQTFLQTTGATSTQQAFSQWNHKLSERLSTNLGVHVLHLSLNNSWSAEPRASVKYDLSAGQSVAFGYGLHGQIQPLGAYFAHDPVSREQLNKNLGITKAHHYVLSHDINLSHHTHLKTEIYYQYLFDVPVSRDPNNTFSMLNVIEGYQTDALVNSGKGTNYGLELTLERFLHRNFYYLLSVSAYQSKYAASNGSWYNTRFNTNYASTLTFGKEWELSEKHKRKVIGLSSKLIYTGGLRRSPINLEHTMLAGDIVYDQANPYSLQNPDYFRLDMKVSMRRNFTHVTTTLSLDVQNTTNQQNVGGETVDRKTGTVKYFYQAGLIPVLAYKVEF